MREAVVDASVVVTVLLDAPHIPHGIVSDVDRLHAPAHLDIESLNALRGSCSAAWSVRTTSASALSPSLGCRSSAISQVRCSRRLADVPGVQCRVIVVD